VSRFAVLWAREFAVEVGVPLLLFAIFMLAAIGLEELGLGWVAATVIAGGIAVALGYVLVRWSVRRRPRGAWTAEQQAQVQRVRKHSSAVSSGARGEGSAKNLLDLKITSTFTVPTCTSNT